MDEEISVTPEDINLLEMSSAQQGRHTAMRSRERHPETGLPPPLPSEKPTCPTGWMMFECNCVWNREHAQSWSEGRKYCQSLGADLVIIKTPEKQRFSKRYIGGWIGLKRGQDGSWRWIDDTPVSTQYWAPGQPDAPVTADCSIGNYPICEKSAFNLEHF